jgi:hypothetical protein
MPVILYGNDAQKKKYLGRMTEAPLVAVRGASVCVALPLCEHKLYTQTHA